MNNPADDAELIEACHAFLAADAALKSCTADKIPAKLFANYYRQLARLTALPARTEDGLKLKAKAAGAAISEVASQEWLRGGHREELAVLSALRDMAGGAAA